MARHSGCERDEHGSKHAIEAVESARMPHRPLRACGCTSAGAAPAGDALRADQPLEVVVGVPRFDPRGFGRGFGLEVVAAGRGSLRFQSAR